MPEERKVTVCSSCLMASCWFGLFMCENAREAGLVEMPVSELDKLHREHPCYYALDAPAKYTGVVSGGSSCPRS